MSHDARLKELKIELPAIAPKLGVYRPLIIAGQLAYLSGHGPVRRTARRFPAAWAMI